MGRGRRAPTPDRRPRLRHHPPRQRRAEHEGERQQREHLALHGARAADRVGGRDQQREADAVRFDEPALDLAAVGLQLPRVPGRRRRARRTRRPGRRRGRRRSTPPPAGDAVRCPRSPSRAAPECRASRRRPPPGGSTTRQASRPPILAAPRAEPHVVAYESLIAQPFVATADRWRLNVLPPPSPHARRQARARVRRGARDHARLAGHGPGQVLARRGRVRARDRLEGRGGGRRATRPPAPASSSPRRRSTSPPARRATSASGSRASTNAEKAGAAVEALHDPKVTQDRADRDRGRPQARRVGQRQALPGDGARRHGRRPRGARCSPTATCAIPLKAQEKIGAYVSARQAKDIAAAKAASASARRFGLIAGLLATLLAVADRVARSAAASAAPPPRCSTA